MKKLVLILGIITSANILADGLPNNILKEFKGLKIKDPQNDITLVDKTLTFKMDVDAPISEIMAKGVVFSDLCVTVSTNPNLFKKYPFDKVKVITPYEYQWYIFNGGVKECKEYWSVEGASKKYESEEYFQKHTRN